MAKDPAFLFYPGDASEDTQFMNRLERGAYFDILKAQKKFGKFSLDQIKKVLGNDFSTCWASLELVLKKDGDFFYIEWVADKIEERKNFSESRRNNRKKKTLDQDLSNTSLTSVKHMVDGIEDEDGNAITIEFKEKEPKENSMVIAAVDILDPLEFRLKEVYTDLNRGDFTMAYRDIDVDDQWVKFQAKVRGSPKFYALHDTEGLRMAFGRHLQNAPKKKDRPSADVMEERKRKFEQS